MAADERKMGSLVYIYSSEHNDDVFQCKYCNVSTYGVVNNVVFYPFIFLLLLIDSVL